MEQIPQEKILGTPNLFDLTDRTAVITGGSRGLGRGMALALSACGVDVAVVSRGMSDLETVVGEIGDLGRKGLAVSVDVTDEKDVEKMVDAVLTEFGKINILINSAGIVALHPTPEFDTEEWQKIIDVNLRGTFLCCKHVGKAMLKQGGGKIINMSSVRGLQGRANDPAYSSTKGAVNQLTKSLAIEWARHNINVNAIAPTFIRTKLNDYLLDDKEWLDWVLGRIPKGRTGEIWDLFGTVVYLASSASDFVTGQVIYVDGGWTVA